MTQTEFNSMVENYERGIRELPVSSWAEPFWTKAVNAGVFDGIAPQAIITREQAAVTYCRMGLVKGFQAYTTVNGWLKLYLGKTVNKEGRIVEIPAGAKRASWYSFEGLKTINSWAIKLMELAGKKAVINIGSKGELTDENGRYWVAVGPNVMNPNHKKDKAVTAEEMKYGTKIDVAFESPDGYVRYLPAVVGDAKAHTYPTGIIQTGNAFPNGMDPHPQNNDGSIVEFIGARLSTGLSDYKISRIFVYDI